MFLHSLSKNALRKIVKISCVIQLINSSIDFFLWITVGYHVPSWALATIVAGYSVLLLSYDKLVS